MQTAKFPDRFTFANIPLFADQTSIIVEQVFEMAKELENPSISWFRLSKYGHGDKSTNLRRIRNTDLIGIDVNRVNRGETNMVKKSQTAWTEIESWLQANVPDALPLPDGVSAEDIEEAEETLEFKIPASVKAFLKVHDGSGDVWMHDLGVFMSLETIMSSWEEEVDLWEDGDNDDLAEPRHPGIKKNWFNRKWLPILDAWTGDYACIDLSPTKQGKSGQIITWRSDNGPGDVVADSFDEFMKVFVDELHKGYYTPKMNQQGRPYLEYNTPS